jgi:charged multivesicular body protein 3
MDKIIQFFKPQDPKQVAKKWQSNIRSEQRRLDSQINDIKRELSKTTREIKRCLKRSDVNSARVLATQVCKARKTIENLYETKANYNSISMRLGESVGRLTQVGSLGKSSEILKVRGDAVLSRRGFAVVS